MQNALQWATAHYGQALALLGFAATIVGTVRNALTYLGVGKGAQGRLAKVADALSWLSEHGKTGLLGALSAPGFASKEKPAPTLKAVP